MSFGSGWKSRLGSNHYRADVIILVTVFSVLVLQFSISSLQMKDLNKMLGIDPGAGISRKTSIVRCFRSYDLPTDEGLGALITRNNLLFFLAHIYSSNISWPQQKSSHRYDVHKLFSTCETPSPSCILRPSKIVIPRCTRANCTCHWKSIRAYVDKMGKTCKVIGVGIDRYRSTEYFGCIRRPIQHYFVHARRPSFDYDAIHLRMGDLAWKPGDKSISSWELQNILQTLCFLSRRPIVILTEGYPLIPKVDCYSRIILATDTTLKDAFTIMSHAKILSVGDSTFALALAEVASPERLVLLQRSIHRYDWMAVNNWTIIDALGVPFHFNDKVLAFNLMTSTTYSKARTERYSNEFNYSYEWEVPKSRYNASFWKEYETNVMLDY